MKYDKWPTFQKVLLLRSSQNEVLGTLLSKGSVLLQILKVVKYQRYNNKIVTCIFTCTQLFLTDHIYVFIA